MTSALKNRIIAGKDGDNLACNICPRKCPSRDTGVCASPEGIKAARSALHFWEEPPISGTKGSGTVFFSGCNLRCVFCQNSEISTGGTGKIISVERLREIYGELIAKGAHNINLVTPTQFAPWIAESLEPKLPVPVVYNCGGYESVDTLRSLQGKIDVYLPDMKYMQEAPAMRYSAARDYPTVAKAAITEMYRQVGDYVLSEDGIMQRGLIVRHLVLPGNVENSKLVIDWFREFSRGKKVMFSLMSQYVPVGNAAKFPEINRKLTQSEYDEVVDYLCDSGIEDGFVQESDSADTEYIPSFDLEGI